METKVLTSDESIANIELIGNYDGSITMQIPREWVDLITTKVSFQVNEKIDSEYAMGGIVYYKDASLFCMSCGGFIAKIPKHFKNVRLGEKLQIGFDLIA